MFGKSRMNDLFIEGFKAQQEFNRLTIEAIDKLDKRLIELENHHNTLVSAHNKLASKES